MPSLTIYLYFIHSDVLQCECFWEVGQSFYGLGHVILINTKKIDVIMTDDIELF